jgi:hypothetical protein
MARSKVITVRLEPRMRYLAELAARQHRWTLSGFIAWALERAFRDVTLADGGALTDEADRLWDPSPAARFAKLAIAHPDLLTHEQQQLWKLIQDCDFFWGGRKDGLGKQWQRARRDPTLSSERLAEYWDLLNAIGAGDKSRSELPGGPGPTLPPPAP